jgi:hypothetical protein
MEKTPRVNHFRVVEKVGGVTRVSSVRVMIRDA